MSIDPGEETMDQWMLSACDMLGTNHTLNTESSNILSVNGYFIKITSACN